ncbi:MAG: hypothetical protein H7X95_07985 [Deltaproteobacteria bacterium]|nr:hypothetical protein [Deltaproteobacteria bacterium]
MFFALAATSAVLAVSACRVDQEEFNNRVFACNVAAPDPGCGVDETGRAMGCFAARQIGATDFCTSTCDINQPQTTDGVCLQAGVALGACHPSYDKDPAAHPLGACNQKDLQCYRTDLLADEGVCTTMDPCDEDVECRDPIRSVCATTFLASLYSQASAVLQRDHMYCLQTGCRSRGTSCSAGETCLQEVIPAAAHPPDICVPNCDSNLHCPPNFLCYRKVSTSITPNVCIPGLLGFTCDDPIDCMLGQCIATGIGYKVCTTPCDSEADCRRFDGEQGKFVCIKNLANPTEPGFCQTPDSYRGSLCNKSDECKPRNADEVCSRFNPKDEQGTCLLPCSADGKCDQRGGIKHTCLPSVVAGTKAAVCFPGYFGLPCGSDGNCFDELVCHPTVPGAPSICTSSCASTADCQGNRWIAGTGWCHPQLRICLSKLDDEEACASNEQCKSDKCNTNKCAPAGEFQ